MSVSGRGRLRVCLCVFFWCACCVCLAVMTIGVVLSPCGFSSVGAFLQNRNHLFFGRSSAAVSCGEKRRVRSLASLVHYRSTWSAKNGQTTRNFCHSTTAVFFSEMVKEDVCVRVGACVCARARVHRVRKTSASAKAATTSRTATQKSTLEVCFIFLLSDISQGAMKAL